MPAKYGAFANKMTGRAASAAAAATTNVIISLPVDQIDENPLNEQVFSMNGISSLAERMKKKGDTSPIRVRRKEDGKPVEKGQGLVGRSEKAVLNLVTWIKKKPITEESVKIIADNIKKEDVDDLKKIRDAIEEIIKVKLQDTGK